MSSNPVRPLTPQTADKLNACIDYLSDLVEQGIDPTSALEKTAEENNLLPDQIRIVARAYNIGLSNYNLHELRDLRALHDNILADAEAVINKLYGTGTKKADAGNNISLWYAYSPEEHVKKARGMGAPIRNITHSPPESSPTSKENELMRLYRRELLKYAQLQQHLLTLADTIAKETDEILDYFKTAGAIHPEEVLDNCSLTDKAAAAILQAILNTEEMKKYAGIVRYRRFVPMDWGLQPYSMLRRLKEHVEDYAELHGVFKEAHDRLNQIRRVMRIPELESPIVTKEADAENEEYEGFRTPFVFQGGFRTPFFRKTAAKGGGGKPKPIEVSKYIKSLTEPISKGLNVERHIRGGLEFSGKFLDYLGRKPVKAPQLAPEVLQANANTAKVLLMDLMLNDPIISNYEPEKVYQAYAKLLQLAPTAATKGEVMRVTLRKLLTTDTLEPKDIMDLINLEKTLTS